MEKIKISFIYLYIILLSKFYCQEPLINYFNGEEITENSPNDNDNEPNDCSCDIHKNSCDYLCCCDEDCPDDAINDWKNRLECIDQQDTVGIFADRCIDEHLVFISNKRRGLRMDKQTEDTKVGSIINNYCYSMDNSKKMTNEIKSLNDLENEGYKKITEEKLRKIIDKLGSTEGNSDDDKYTLNISSTNAFFSHNKKFSLYSGSLCAYSNHVKKLKTESYSCYYNGRIITKNDIENIDIEDHRCSIINQYKIDDNGIIDLKNPEELNNGIIREVEFLLKIDQLFKINNCTVNIVWEENDGSEAKKNYKFKNSVFFVQKNETERPYRYSGQGNYFNSFPLIIANNTGDIYKEYFITGKNSDNSCNTSMDISNYFYDKDKAISFNENMFYECKLNNDKVSDTVLYKKIKNIAYISKYGSFGTVNDRDWINVSQKIDDALSKIEEGRNQNYFNMSIYISSNEVGKFIYDVRFSSFSKSEENSDKFFQFNVKFHDLEAIKYIEDIYYKNPDPPTILPRLPEDLLDPLIASEVDK